MPGPKLNENPVLRRRPTSRAVSVATPTPSARALARYVRVSPYKVREVLDLIRGHDAQRALEILRFSERDAATVVGKVLASAVANAERDPHNLVADELFVSACFADEGPTLKRWRPRARGRATRIRKRTCHVTVIVSRLPDRELQERRAQRAQALTGRRGRRPAGPGRQPERPRAGRRRQDEAAGQVAPTPDAVAPTTEEQTAAPVAGPSGEQDTPPPAADDTPAADDGGAPEASAAATTENEE